MKGREEDEKEKQKKKCEIVASFTSLNASKAEKWNEANYITYLLLQKGDQVKTLQAKVDGYIKKIAKDEMQLKGNQFMAYHLQPMTQVHLHSALDGLEPNTNIPY